ncbi:type II toxin-antitoxin system RelE/ParE family toxin [Pelosinus baikalensis]|uniref:Type II toxin-antitoxin system RelE/ParE family toxin n=1 Tax=Pelosinus baikalensis TaxID=2892015 RepID=A0ABS8HQC6_9FIRM|nr:type II toxin-antitoxin system RelE/ParE family toxin [Pelosinus baikalensis]MCC5465379.1 type II toxin-antitoxin system RelE/ParE family toxin [Pelosinus baikalensis]
MGSENKKYTVVISDEATQMLVSHTRFLAQVSETAALRLIDAFQQQTRSLEQFPERSPWLTDPMISEGKYRKLLLEKKYLLVYQIKENTVYVDAILDTRQEYSWLL